MKALSRLKSAINQSSLSGLLALVIIAPFANPALAQAAELQTSGQSAVVFKINPQLVLQNQNFLSYNQLTEQDPLVVNLKAYLKKHGSPLAEYAEEIPTYPQWQRALAISWVESNFGKFCPGKSNNCSGIGVAPGHALWRTYPTKLDWFADLSKLLEKPMYKDKYNTCQKMKGIYVYPGSANWVYGCEQKLKELNNLTETAQEQRYAMQANASLALFGAPINSKID